MEELIRIEGSVSAVVFQNAENGYTVLRLKDGKGETTTVVGTVPDTNVGERLRVEGRWSSHSTYGKQLEIVNLERLMPESRIEILAYLSSHAIRGVGPKIAARIVERFGADSLKIIENEPEQLATVPGISEAKAREIQESFQSQQGLRHLAEFLSGYRLPTELAVKIYKAYGELSMMAIQDNPYFLTEEGFNANFSQVDAFALELGFDGDDERRVDAGILYELSYNSTGGHVFVPEPQLVEATAAFLRLPQEVIRAGLERLNAQERIVLDPIASLRAVYLPAYGQAERYLARRFTDMVRGRASLPVNLARTVADIEAAQSIEYAELQRKAITGALSEGMLVLTGGPGTGKTTTLNAIIKILQSRGKKVLLAAPTGRAAQRMSELTGDEAKTLHRLLEVSWDKQDNPIFNKNEKANRLYF